MGLASSSLATAWQREENCVASWNCLLGGAYWQLYAALHGWMDCLCRSMLVLVVMTKCCKHVLTHASQIVPSCVHAS